MWRARPDIEGAAASDPAPPFAPSPQLPPASPPASPAPSAPIAPAPAPAPRELEPAAPGGADLVPAGDAGAALASPIPPARPRPFANPAHDVWDFARDPRWFAGATFLLGLAGVFLSQVDFVQRLLFIAPVFEELLKFGAALGLVLVIRLRFAVGRVVVALLPGAGFGVLEHFTTYAQEEPTLYAIRVAFHAGATAASMATWCALEGDPEWKLRWITTVPATIVHGINNALALVVGIVLSILPLPDVEAVALLAHVGLMASVYVLALAALLAPTTVRSAAAGALRIVA